MNRRYLPFAFCYTSLIIYASLFPFTGWCVPQDDVLAWLAFKLPQHISKSDLLVNVLAYIPLGLFWAKLFLTGEAWLGPLYLAAFIGCGTSFSMEALQAFLPARVSSVTDLAANSAGTLTGALLALFFRSQVITWAGLGTWRKNHLLPGMLCQVGMAVIACWALSQLAPFFPTLDIGELKNAIKPLWYTINDLSRFDGLKANEYACSIAGLAIVALTTAKDQSRSRVLRYFVMFAGIILCSKIFFTGRQLSLEALTGLALGSALAGVLARLPRTWQCYAGLALLIAGFVIMETKAGPTATPSPPFNWIPFRGQLSNELNGFETILEGAWPFAGLSYLSMILLKENATRSMMIGGVAAFLLVFGLERLQLSIPGRTADITQAIIAAAGWYGPQLFCWRSGQAAGSYLPFTGSQ